MSEIIWDGKGQPPVECICISPQGRRVIITYQGDGVGCYKEFKTGNEYSYAHSSYIFTPIKSERDKAIEDLLSIFHKNSGTLNTFMGHIYDAGYRKVKTDDL